MRIAINTGGGDAPGLNAVVRAAVLSAERRGWDVVGIRRGYDGLFNLGGVVPLDGAAVRGITHLGGTILGTTNRGSPFSYPEKQPDGSVRTIDRSDEVIARMKRLRIDCLIAVGGDGSLRIASELGAKGLNVIGVPKTIDNDLQATQVTFGFHTAVQTATDAIDKLHSTAEAHQRIMVVELMGRHAGWIALFAGFAATADAILIPEFPYDIEKVAAKIRQRYREGPEFAIVVVAEGAKPKGGEVSYLEEIGLGGGRRLGGSGEARVAATAGADRARVAQPGAGAPAAGRPADRLRQVAVAAFRERGDRTGGGGKVRVHGGARSAGGEGGAARRGGGEGQDGAAEA